MSEHDEVIAELVAFFRTLVDVDRLKVLGILAREPTHVEGIAGILRLSPSTVLHHLSRLGKAGLVSAQQKGGYTVYQIEADALEGMARRLLARAPIPSPANELDLDSFDKKIVKDFSDEEGKYWRIPARHKKMQAVLRHVIQSFEPGVEYTEKQVNGILKPFNEDTARLRRELVDNGFLVRNKDGSAYSRVDG